MKIKEIKEEQIAPCGANCMICMAFLRTKKHCPGCRFEDTNKAKSCVLCKIKNCPELNGNSLKYCFQCSKYPCEKIYHIDKRYRKNYSYNMIESLNDINKYGIKSFLKNEKTKWICKKCGGVICVHRGFCTECGEIYYENMRPKPLRGYGHGQSDEVFPGGPGAGDLAGWRTGSPARVTMGGYPVGGRENRVLRGNAP